MIKSTWRILLISPKPYKVYCFRMLQKINRKTPQNLNSMGLKRIYYFSVKPVLKFPVWKL